MAQDQTFEVWITKYALSTGIRKETVRQSLSPDMVVTDDRWKQCFHGEGRDWHRTRESAEARADMMRQAKILSLRKQIMKLGAMTFTEKGSE